jgi:phosphoribosylformylglycinamidine cyclo-ligase
MLKDELARYSFGSPIELPFGFVYPSPHDPGHYFDMQIEGIGTKTLLAELSERGYSTIGIDAVAMTVNDVIRSGSKPVLLSDAIHISESAPGRVKALLGGVLEGARLSGTVLASGETGEVPEILHETLSHSTMEPLDLIISCLGICKNDTMIAGDVNEGDDILGLESSGIHSNGLTLARQILLKRWGGRFDDYDEPAMVGRPLLDELLEPTRIYVRPLLEASNKFHVKAAVHITGDGFGKFKRLLGFILNSRKKVGLEFDLAPKASGIFALISETARTMGKPLSAKEMFTTFNMGYGFAVIVPKEMSDTALDLFNKYCPTRKIGKVSKGSGIKLFQVTADKKSLKI